MFCCAVLCALSSFAIILKGKRELDALLFFYLPGGLQLLLFFGSSSMCYGLVCSYFARKKFVIVVTRLEYSDVTCHVVLLYSVNWTKIGSSFIFPTVNLFRY